MIEVENLTKVYNGRRAVDNISFKVDKGEILGFLGPNGAGKTTALKAISGLLKPENGEVTEGSVLFDGKPIHNQSPETITRAGIIQVLAPRDALSPAPSGRVFTDHLKVAWGHRLLGYCANPLGVAPLPPAPGP